VMRHPPTRIERPPVARRAASAEDEDGTAVDEGLGGPPPDDEDEVDTEFIDESESEAAPAATDR